MEILYWRKMHCGEKMKLYQKRGFSVYCNEIKEKKRLRLMQPSYAGLEVIQLTITHNSKYLRAHFNHFSSTVNI